MAKKQKGKPKGIPTKRRLSRWQREERIRRIIIIAAAVFLAGIIGYVGYSYYNDKIKFFRGIVIEVNDASFNMDYYVKMLDAQTRGMESTYLYYMADQVAMNIENAELMKQGANDLGIVVSTRKIDEEIKKNELPNDRVYRDIVRVSLLQERLTQYFDSQLPDKMEQAHIQVMLVEDQEVANGVMAEIESGEDFTTLVNKFSYDASSKGKNGDLGWLPEELMPMAIAANAFQLEPGEVSPPLYDESAPKDIGYWLIEVTDKNEEKGIKARAILLGSKQKAEEVKAKLTDENFADLAEEYSQHQASKSNGGELGWLKEGDTNSDAFDEVAFSLGLAVISEPVKDESAQTKGGYWIVKVLGKGEHELSEEIRGMLVDNDFSRWLQEQRGRSIINNYLDEEKKSLAIYKVLEGR